MRRALPCAALLLSGFLGCDKPDPMGNLIPIPKPTMATSGSATAAASTLASESAPPTPTTKASSSPTSAPGKPE